MKTSFYKIFLNTFIQFEICDIILESNKSNHQKIKTEIKIKIYDIILESTNQIIKKIKTEIKIKTNQNLSILSIFIEKTYRLTNLIFREKIYREKIYRLTNLIQNINDTN